MENKKFNKVWFTEFIKKLPFRQNNKLSKEQERIFLDEKEIIDLSPKNEQSKLETLFN